MQPDGVNLWLFDLLQIIVWIIWGLQLEIRVCGKYSIPLNEKLKTIFPFSKVQRNLNLKKQKVSFYVYNQNNEKLNCTLSISLYQGLRVRTANVNFSVKIKVSGCRQLN